MKNYFVSFLSEKMYFLRHQKVSDDKALSCIKRELRELDLKNRILQFSIAYVHMDIMKMNVRN